MFFKPTPALRAIAALFAAAALAEAQPVAVVSPVPKLQFFDNNGKPMAGGCVATYQAGTTTPLATYTDASGATANPNPVVLDSAGRAAIWIKVPAIKYVVKLKGTGCSLSTGTILYTTDNVQDAGLRVRADLAGTGGAGFIGYTPPGAGAQPGTVQDILNNAVWDTSFDTLAHACAAAASSSHTLFLTKSWPSVPAQTCAAIVMAAGGIIHLAAGAVFTFTGGITAPGYKWLDSSAAGSSFALGSAQADALWWGADRTEATDSADAISACIAATLRCNISEGKYVTLSTVTTMKHDAILHCASRSTTITYKGAAVASAFVWGGLAFQNHDTVENCTFQENNNVTGQTVYVNAADATHFENVSIFGGASGLFLNGSVFFVANTLQVGKGPVSGSVPALGVKVRGSNQATFFNPIIQQMPGATGMDIDGSGGVSVQSGSLEEMSIGAVIGPSNGIVTFTGVDLEALPGDGIRTSGGGFTLFGPCACLTNIHVTSQSRGFRMINASAFKVIIDAGAVESMIESSTFDPGDSPTPSAEWLIDNGTNTQFSNNLFIPGAIRQEDWINRDFISAFRGQPYGCRNCVDDSSGTPGQITGTYTHTRELFTPKIYDGYPVRVYLANAIAAGTIPHFNFTGIADYTGSAPGNLPVWNQSPGAAFVTARSGATMITLVYSVANGGWISY